MKISELTDDQKSHLAYRLEHNTYCGAITSCRIAKGEFGDMELEEAFRKADKSPRSAKILAKKVMEFKPDPNERFIALKVLEIGSAVVAETKELSLTKSPEIHLKLLRKLSEYFSGFADSYERLMKAAGQLQ